MRVWDDERIRNDVKIPITNDFDLATKMNVLVKSTPRWHFTSSSISYFRRQMAIKSGWRLPSWVIIALSCLWVSDWKYLVSRGRWQNERVRRLLRFSHRKQNTNSPFTPWDLQNFVFCSCQLTRLVTPPRLPFVCVCVCVCMCLVFCVCCQGQTYGRVSS